MPWIRGDIGGLLELQAAALSEQFYLSSQRRRFERGRRLVG